MVDIKIKETFNGVNKTRYWTPDGRQIDALPGLRGFSVRKNGKVIRSGVRDINLTDKGWLSQPPADPKPYCKGCDKWHDTQKEVDECIANKNKSLRLWEKKAQGMKKEEGGDLRAEVDELKGDISDIKSMLTKLLEAK